MYVSHNLFLARLCSFENVCVAILGQVVRTLSFTCSLWCRIMVQEGLNMFALTTIKCGHSGVDGEGIDVENHPFCFCLHVSVTWFLAIVVSVAFSCFTLSFISLFLTCRHSLSRLVPDAIGPNPL